MLVRLTGKSSAFRNALSRAGWPTTAWRRTCTTSRCPSHRVPRPRLRHRRLPNALAQFENEVTLPLHTLLSDEDVDYVAGSFKRALDGLEAEGVR